VANKNLYECGQSRNSSFGTVTRPLAGPMMEQFSIAYKKKDYLLPKISSLSTSGKPQN
jgi:hypothetical protein